MKYIINQSGIVFFYSGKPIKVEKNSVEYAKIIKAFDLPDHLQEDAINQILENKSGNYIQDGLEVTPDYVAYKGEKMPQALADKIRSIVREGLPVTFFAKFWENLQKNPSANSVRELYDFLAYKELPITEDGCFLAYKGVRSDYFSVSGNLETVVVKGTVDNAGRILNKVGEEIEVSRNYVDDDRRHHCSFGLHVGSLNYATNFGTNTVVVKVNPKDVVSVPSDYDCQKCRVCAYEVISIYSEEITSAVTDSSGEPIESEEKIEYSDFEKKIENYLEKKRQDQVFVPLRAIQNMFSPKYPSQQRVLDALSSLNYRWIKQNNQIVVIL